MRAINVMTTHRARVSATIACTALSLAVASAPAAVQSQTQRIDALIRGAVTTGEAQAVLVQAQIGRRIVLRKAYGQSLTGVPARVDMHYRNGNMAAAYVSALLLRLVDQGRVKLSDPVSKYRPELRDRPGPGDGDRVTLGMLAGMTAGYHDFEQDPKLAEHIYRAPFAPFRTRQQLALALSEPMQFRPGTNYSYSHTDYVILGLVLERVTKLPLEIALRREVLTPLGLANTRYSGTAAIPEPILHTYSSERRDFLGIPRGRRFLEETTFWSPAWTFPRGAVQTTNLADMTRSIIGIGTGRLLRPASYRTQIRPRIGFGRPQAGCERCQTLDRTLGYGLGVYRRGSWIAVQPLFAGLGSVAGYLPSKRIALTVVTAMGERGFDEEGAVNNLSRPLFAQIGKILAPSEPPP